MTFHPLPPYFIVKVNKESQSNRREKIGSLYLHFKEVFMQRNMQHGEIVAIGSAAKQKIPQANVSDTLIFHHFVEGQENTQSNFLHSDETYNYYFVTAYEFNGHRNETYAIDNGKEIIPHPDFVFIEHEEEIKEISADEFIEKNTKQVGSLILFNNWEESREEKEEKAKRLMAEIKNQSKGKSMSDSTKRGLEEKQIESGKITASLNKKEYKPFKVFAFNPTLKIKETIYSLSLSAQTEIDYNDKKYIVIQSKYACATA
ncbi:MAG: hypothetical protein ABI091_26770 [Ferruginibacter sp.]